MAERAAQDGSPAYLERAEAMGIEDLRVYIKDELQRVGTTADGVDRPSSEQDFRKLWRILRAKVKGSAGNRIAVQGSKKKDAPPLERLGYLKNKLERLEIRQIHARGEPGTKKRDIHQMQRRREELQAEIEVLEDETYRSRSTYYPFHNRSSRSPRFTDDPLAEILTEVRKDIDRVFRPAQHFVHWRLLPPGELSIEGVHRYYSGLQVENPRARYDLERVEKALSLRPHQSYEEIDGIEGYIVFRFPHTTSALMECPKTGNAIYIIHKDWERWSKMSKQELMGDETGEVVRVPHQGDWFAKVKDALGIDDAA